MQVDAHHDKPCIYCIVYRGKQLYSLHVIHGHVHQWYHTERRNTHAQPINKKCIQHQQSSHPSRNDVYSHQKWDKLFLPFNNHRSHWYHSPWSDDDPSYLLLAHVEVVDDDTDEEVKGEEASAHDEYDKVEVVVDWGLPLGLLVDLSGVHGVGHHLHPSFEGGLGRGRIYSYISTIPTLWSCPISSQPWFSTD